MQEFYWLFLQQVERVHKTSVGYQTVIQDLFFFYLLYGLIIKFIEKNTDP